MLRIKGGYLRKIARIDLSKRKFKVEHVKPDFAIKYIGGRGWGARILWDEVPATVNPLSVDNKLIVATGPLTGLLIPGAAKTSFNAISPQTGLYGDSNMGGMFGTELKQAGFDALILEKTANSPSYVLIEDGQVEVRDAKHLWGMGSLDTEVVLKKELGDELIRVASIGPAGENLVKFACVTGDYGRQAGRTGIGAVLGSKKVKAIAVRGDQDIPVADIDALKTIFEETESYLAKHRDLRIWQRQGTMTVVDWSQANAALPTRNFQAATYENSQQINGDSMETKTKTTNRACFMCPMACGQFNVIKEGKQKGVSVEGPEYETASLLGSNCALPTIEDVVYANFLCDNLGIDTISAGNVAAFAMECFEKGIITKEQLGGLELKFGNPEALFRLLEMIAHREGIGDLLAEGVKKASQKIGKESEKFAMQVKGLEISGYDHRAAQAQALAYATCVPRDTEVFLSNGEIVEIGNLVEDELKKMDFGGAAFVTNFNGSIFTWNDNHLVERKIVAVQKLQPPKKLIELKPASGVPVKFTPDHKVLIDTDDGPKWIEASQLKTRDWTYAPRKILNKNPICPNILAMLPDDTIVADDWLKKECQEALLSKFGSIKRASKELNIPRNPLSQRSRQDLRLKYIKKICDATNLDLSSIYNSVKELRGNSGMRVSLTTPVVTENFMYLIGLIASDGYIRETDRRYRRSHTIIFTNKNEQLAKLFVEISWSIFPTIPVKIKKVNCIFRIITPNFVLANVANSLGIHSPKEKTTLSGIFKLPENLIATFIRGYFDGDGTCHFKKASHYHIKITTGQPRTAKRLHQLLKRLNIRSNIFKRKENFDIVMSTPGDTLEFIIKIGSNHPKKAKLLEEISRNLKGQYSLDDFDLMPLICGKHIKTIRDRYGVVQHALPIYRGQLRKAEKLKLRLRRTSLRKIVETLQTLVPSGDRNLEILSTICESPFYVEQLKEVKEELLVEDDTNKFVYDITVEKAHSFLPEGVMVVSNCDVGAHHNRAWAITYDTKVGREAYTKDKAEWVIYLQHIRPLFDCLGTCRLQWVELALDPEYYARFYSAATGVPMTLAGLLKSSERIYNLTRAINVKRGLTDKDDWLPDRDFEDPVSVGSISAAKLDRNKFRDFLRLYYKLRGWNENGVPTREKLVELDLKDISRELERLKAHV